MAPNGTDGNVSNMREVSFTLVKGMGRNHVKEYVHKMDTGSVYAGVPEFNAPPEHECVSNFILKSRNREIKRRKQMLNEPELGISCKKLEWNCFSVRGFVLKNYVISQSLKF